MKLILSIQSRTKSHKSFLKQIQKLQTYLFRRVPLTSKITIFLMLKMKKNANIRFHTLRWFSQFLPCFRDNNLQWNDLGSKQYHKKFSKSGDLSARNNSVRNSGNTSILLPFSPATSVHGTTESSRKPKTRLKTKRKLWKLWEMM